MEQEGRRMTAIECFVFSILSYAFWTIIVNSVFGGDF